MMLAKRLLISTMMLILVPFSVFGAEWISVNGAPEGTAPSVQVLESDQTHTVLRYTLPGFYLADKSIGALNFQQIIVPECDGSLKIGSPDLPRLIEQVGIPDDADVFVQEIDREFLSFDQINVFPVQQPLKDKTPDSFSYETSAYQSRTAFPSKMTEISTPAIWRDIRLISVSYYPIISYPGLQRIEATKSITVELIYHSGSKVNVKSRLSNEISPKAAAQYKAAIINYDDLNLTSRKTKDTSVNYLIIADDTLVSAVQPLADWWMRAGLKTVIRPTSEVGTTTTAIKNEILNYYTTEGIEYVLLVGETTQIPVWSFTHGSDSGVGDHDYTTVDGSDYYSDVALGRIITSNPDKVSHVVARTLNYIMNPPNDGWLEKTILCAHEEEYPGKYTQCKNEILGFSYSVQTPIFSTYYPPEGATHAQVIAALQEGRGLVNYRGHGDTQEWSWSIGMVNSDIHGLNNGAYTPVVFNICCNNGEVDSTSECLSEAWQNAGSSGEGGAVANLGASRPSYTVENHTLDKVLYQAMFDQGIWRAGDVVDAGNNATIAMSTYGEFNARIYMLFGDPAMDISTNDLETLTVDHLPSVPMGGSDFQVTVTSNSVPIENALVCILKDTECYETGYTDAAGSLTLPTTILSGGTMTLTITAHNFYPHMEEVPIEAIGCGAVMLDNSIYNCDQEIMIRVWDADLNVNPSAPDTAQVDITSSSESTPEILTLTETGPDTSEFRGTIQTSATQSGPGFLMLTDLDVITVIYHDADCDGSPRDVQDTATADCVGPIISNVTLSDLGVDTVTISWTTDELSDSVLLWGDSSPPMNEESSARLVTTHSLTVDILDSCTEYFFQVKSTDIAGNYAMTEIQNFTTLQLILMLEANMDTDPGWTYTGDWAWGQPTGQDDDPTAGNTGTNVVGYNLNGAYPDSMPVYYTTTSAFDCSGASQAYLGFWRWLGVESSSYDHATIEISTNGTTWTPVWSHTGGTMQDNAWTYLEYDISEWAAGQSSVSLRWGMGPSDGSVSLSGWNIDDVQVMYTTPCNVPVLVYESHVIDDSVYGNNDGEINAGESIEMPLTLENLGLTATGVSATISTTNSNVTITTATSDFPDIAQSGMGTSVTEYAFSTSSDMIDGEAIPFTVSWTSNENAGSTNFTEMAVAPVLSIDNIIVLDVGGDNDGVLDPGESAQIQVELANSGHGTAHLVIGTMSSDNPSYMTINDNEASFPDIAPSGSGTSLNPHYTVTASSDIPDHTMVTFTLSIGAGSYYVQDTFQLDVTASNFARRYSWDMDTNPGWTGEGQWAWGDPTGTSGDPQDGYTGTNVVGYNLNGAYPNNMPEHALTTQALDCSNLQAVELRFMRWLGVESSSYDHAYVRISTNGTTWTNVWSHSGSTMTETSWSAQTYDISSYADGQPTVYLRWVMGTTDVSLTYCGWNIDDVEIWAESFAGGDTPTPTVTGSVPTWTPTPLPGTPTPTRTPTFTPPSPTNTPYTAPPTLTPTPTRTPTPTNPPTVPPTIPPTVVPTYTASPTPTNTAVVPPTDTPVLPPTHTPPPEPTNTPTQPPIPDKGMELFMDDQELNEGDLFNLYFKLHNPDPSSYDCDAYLLLGIQGMYWCWPSWSDLYTSIDSQEFTVPAQTSLDQPVLEFNWPASTGAVDGLQFIGCIFEPGTWNIIGQPQIITWSYSS